MEDRDRVARLLGHKVAVVLSNGAGMVATLDEVRDDGVGLSEMSELGPGPTMFCPWDSLRRLRDRPPFFMPPPESPESGEYYELYEHREAGPEEIEPEPYVEHRRAARVAASRQAHVETFLVVRSHHKEDLTPYSASSAKPGATRS